MDFNPYQPKDIQELRQSIDHFAGCELLTERSKVVDSARAAIALLRAVDDKAFWSLVLWEKDKLSYKQRGGKELGT